MFGFELPSWMDIVLFIVVFLFLMTIFGAVMRRWLGIEKRKLFFDTTLNDHHKKIDTRLRDSFIVLLIIGYLINSTRMDLNQDPLLFLEPWFLIIIMIISNELVQAYMERKYAKNPNDYLYTLSQLVFFLLIIAVMLTTIFFST